MSSWPHQELASPDMAHYLLLIQRACAQAHELLQDVLYIGDLNMANLQRQPIDLVGGRTLVGSPAEGDSASVGAAG